MERKLKINLDNNNLLFGDCKGWLPFVPDNSVDLIYIDPPFFSNKNYEVIWGNGHELRSFGDRWKGGIEHYIGWMRERLIEAHRVLKPNGSIFLHCNRYASHRLRLLLEERFGEKNFVNEIIWCFKGGGNYPTFSHKHDTIFWYSKTKKGYIWNKQFQPYTEKTLKRGLTKCKGKYSESGLNKQGANMVDWWSDIDKLLSPDDHEKIGYDTQKPEKLLERIIDCSTKKNDIVLDFFGGGGDDCKGML